VQRRIVRRAIRHGYKLGKKSPFFHKLVKDLVQLMGEAYPNLAAQEARITEVLRSRKSASSRPWPTACRSWTPRWPVAQGAARRRGLQAARHLRLPARPVGRRVPRARREVDEAGFAAAMEQQKAQARAAGKFKMDKALEYTGDATPSPAMSTWKNGPPRSSRCTLTASAWPS
jgi:alanyl-tRNA synthetase